MQDLSSQQAHENVTRDFPGRPTAARIVCADPCGYHLTRATVTARFDINRDGAIDFVVSEPGPGADGIWETNDDSARLVTLLNTTVAAPVRCIE